MSKSVLGFALALLVGLGTMTTPNRAVAADLLWANVTIDRVLQTAGPAQVRLTDVGGVFSNKLFNISNDKQNAMVAVLLAALALGKDVRIAFNDGSPAVIVLVGVIN